MIARPQQDQSAFTARVLIVALVGILIWIAAQLADLFLLVFAAIIVAIVLRGLAHSLERLKVPSRWSLTLAIVLLAAALVGLGWLTGAPLTEQMVRLREQIPEAVSALQSWLKSFPAGTVVLDFWGDARDAMPWGRIAGLASSAAGALGSAVVVLVTGIFLAADPGLYRRGLVRLFPHRWRRRADEALSVSGGGLSKWLLGQAISMAFVGITTWLGLLALGVPLAFALGVVCGLLAFVPYIGAFAGGGLAVALALVQSPTTALHVLLLFVAIQQIEGHLLTPLVQKWTVSLPPALGVLATVAFGLLFKLPGVLLATPLIVVVMLLIEKVWVHDVLEKPAPADGGHVSSEPAAAASRAG